MTGVIVSVDVTNYHSLFDLLECTGQTIFKQDRALSILL